MAPQKDEAEISEKEEISRLLANARDDGERDVFAGKRRWPRYCLAMNLEVALEGADPSDVLQVVLHDISAGGCGFWSNESIPVGAKILIREWSPEKPGRWLSAVVTHSSLGIGGHRVGAAFCDAPDPGPTRAADEATEDLARSPQIAVSSSELPRRSLRTKCAGISAATSTLAILAATTVCPYVRPDISPVWVSLVASGLAFGLAGLLVWADLTADLSFLKSLRAEIKALVQDKPNTVPPAKATSRELGQIRQALAELHLVWRKRQQQEHQSRQKLEELNFLKTNILSMVSHDLRTPLTSILLYARMLEEGLTSLAEDDQRRFLKIISEECTRLSHLVDDLLQAQRLESERVQWNIQSQDLSDTIRACGASLQPMAESKSIDLTIDFPDSLPAVEADADKIAQVLSNLVSNALKYTPEGGKVRLSAQPEGTDVLICVSDNGPGIPRDQWDQIFDRFGQAHSSSAPPISGVGLGLYIVRQIVDQHGGRVWVDSEVGRGSDFYVALPTKHSATSPSSVQVPPTSSVQAPPTSVGRVLVCDPDPELADKIRQILRKEGFNVRVAYSGCRLLALLEQGHTDVVVTDILLPDMNATDLLDAMNQGGRRTFGLVVHSYAGEGYGLRQRGVDVFVGRPAKREEIVQAVKLAVRKQRNTGLVALLMCPRWMGDRLQPTLLEAGHTPIFAPTIENAIATAGNYSLDLVIVAEEALAADWSDLERLRNSMEPRTRIVVVCKRIGRAQRKRAERHGVRLIQYATGKESEVLATVLDCELDGAEEIRA